MIIVFGAPGTGKTTWIKEYIKDKNPRDLFISSHTNASVREIVKSVGLSPKKFRFLGTIHSYCYKLLKDKGYEFAGIFEENIKQFNEEYGYDISYNILEGGVINNTISDTEYMDYVRRRHEGEVNINTKLAQDIKEFKEKYRYIEYVDMILLCMDMDLYGEPMKEIIIDEAQDLSDMQACYVDLLAQYHKCNVINVGDDDQCLYRFSGVSGLPMMKEGEKIILKHSYRVPSKIGEFAKSVIRKIKDRVDKDFTYSYDGGELFYLRIDELCDFIQDKVKQGESVMILGRTRYIVLTCIIPVLNYRDILYNNIYCTMNEYSNIKDDKVLKVFLALYKLSIGEYIDYNALSALCDVLKTENGFKEGFKSMVRNKMIHGGTKDDLASWFNDEFLKRLDNFKDFIIIKTYEKKFNLYYQYYQKYGIGFTKYAGKVIPGTVHSVKGGEADWVLFAPYYTRKISDAMYENIESYYDELRVLYVAITRARKGFGVLDLGLGDKIYDEMSSIMFR